MVKNVPSHTYMLPNVELFPFGKSIFAD